MPKRKDGEEEEQEPKPKRVTRQQQQAQELTEQQKTLAQGARQRFDTAVRKSAELCSKTVASSETKKTASGFAEDPPQGFDRASADQVKALADEIGYEFTDGGASDQANTDGYFKGRYYACHAEKQVAVLDPGAPIAVSKPMCLDCRKFFQKLAQKKDTDLVVVDSEVTRVFHSDGKITEVYDLDPLDTHQVTRPADSRGEKPGIDAIEPCAQEDITEEIKGDIESAQDESQELDVVAAQITTKTVAVTQNKKTASGFAEDAPPGFNRATAQQVKTLADSFNPPHVFRDGGASDQSNSDGYFMGRYYACHAEKQAAVLDPNKPISVSKPMCDDCRKFFRGLAKKRNQVQVVADPDCTRLFYPNGYIKILAPNGDEMGEKFPSMQP